MMKLVLLLILVAVLTVTSSVAQVCIGKPCNHDSACACSDESLICNYKNQCQISSFWDRIVRRKPCFRIYKKSCLNDSDCPCDGKLMCEDGECVQNKNVLTRAL